ncbi:MAG: hypothetical protein P1U63_06400 [Coxiellaceae bacterium]|nr:hypothetical protein [Coxiellaceae bacterium]
MNKALRYGSFALTAPVWGGFAAFYSGSFAIGLRLSMCMANIGENSCFDPENMNQELKDSSLFSTMVLFGALGGVYAAYRLTNAYFPAPPADKASCLQKGLHATNQNRSARLGFKALVAIASAFAGVSIGWGLGLTSETSWCQTFVKYCFETDDQYKPKLMKSWVFLIPQVFLGISGLLAGYKVAENELDSATNAVEQFNPAMSPLLAGSDVPADPYAPPAAANMA